MKKFQPHSTPKYQFLCRVTNDNYDFLCRVASFNGISLAAALNGLIENARQSGIKSKTTHKPHVSNGSCQMSQPQ